ncbi:MAG: 50S ribosomal protein L3 [Bacteroidota bacterium]|nr:50S ribosomal protein L3 [Candidatus Kapabacteria bacterium]MCS7302340.1 50S ribosomal protein L3 [Candidatus Kapabacteria bacterium]MCX7936915.1 50S ribosomal protein L3 [Chlorobiota bacterium]MDW8075306.1 50S ribosomal protein L3 [Bacteroidota bacterium]MDW8271918.1 50S ribosomal protein L3 [Bacteroidota bacterium]
MAVLLGRKLGMTGFITETGEYVPCTVIEAGPCPVVLRRTLERDGYEAIQIGFEPIPPRKVNRPLAGHFAKAGVQPHRYLREFRGVDANVGDVLTVAQFQPGDRVKISATSIGRGFQGVVKRHHFAGVGMATHGQSDRTRAPGSIGASSFPSRVFPGMRMAGRMGGRRTTIRNLEVLRVIEEDNLLLVKGSIPGAPNALVEIVKLS